MTASSCSANRYSRQERPISDCAYALIGIEKQPNEFKIEAIPNSAIGQAPTILEFEAPQESPAVEKYRSAMTVLSIIITAALLIWYFFIK